MKKIFQLVLLTTVFCAEALRFETSAEGKLKLEQITLEDKFEPTGLFLDLEINSEL